MSNKTVKSLICDDCGNELIEYTSYPARYSLQLKSIDTNINNTGMEFGCCVYPPIKETLHFCGLRCLGSWCTSNINQPVEETTNE